jgi:hypothetical protein
MTIDNTVIYRQRDIADRTDLNCVHPINLADHHAFLQLADS